MIFSALRMFILAPLPFLLIPFFLKKLGPSGYGTWAIFMAANAITSLADLGLVTTLSKHVAELYALKDVRGLSSLLSTGVALCLGIASLLSLVLWVGAPVLISTLFRRSPTPGTELQVLWRYLICIIFANTLIMMFSSVVVGLQRMDLSTALSSLNVLLSAALSVLFLVWNWGLRGVLCGYALAAWITLAISIYAVHRLLPNVQLRPFACRLAVAKEIFSFSVKTYVTQIAVVIHNQIEKIYLATFAGVVFVGWYDISSDLALKLRGIPSLVLAPILPAASELHALSDQARLARLYYNTHKYLAFLGVPLVAYIVFVSKPFAILWLGPTRSIIAVPLCALLIANFVNLTTGPGLQLLVGAGNLRPGLQSAVAGVIVNVIVSFFLIRSYGFQGAIIGTSGSVTLSSTFFLYLFRRETKAKYPKVVRGAYLKPMVCSAVSIGLLWLLTHAEKSSWSKLALDGAIFASLYLVFLFALQFFDASDLAMAERFVTVPKILRRIIPDAELGSSLLPHSQSAQTTVS